MNSAVVVDVLRTPMGRAKADGAFVGMHPTELLAQLFVGVVERNGVDPGMVDDVIIGCVTQVGEQSSTPGRGAWLAAGFPQHVPSTTIERKCGSSQQAIHFGAQGIMAGAYDIVICGGVESMSRVPMGSNRMGRDPYGSSFYRRFPDGLVAQGVSSELVASKWGISRHEMDVYAARSHHLASLAEAGGQFAKEILPIKVTTDSVEKLISKDQTIRAGSSVERLVQLKPSFEDEALSLRFPHIKWSVTAGNSSQISDGAALTLLMSEKRASQLNLDPRARIIAFDVVGDDPVLMLTAPIAATRRALNKIGMNADQIDHFEINEAFASVPLAWKRELGVGMDRLNPLGGAIALGHPLGASGARLFTTLVNGLEANGGHYGLQAMCEAGGMANATVVERL